MALKKPRTYSLVTNYSPRPRNSDLFSNTSATPSPLATKDNLFSISSNIRKSRNCKTVELVQQSEGVRTVRLYQTFELYFVPTDIAKGKQFCIKSIRKDNLYGIDFGKLGIGKGWILTKIGHDVDAKKLMFGVTRNRLLSLAKLAKTAGYQVTFEGNELNTIIEEKKEYTHIDTDTNTNNDEYNISTTSSSIDIDKTTNINGKIIDVQHITRAFIDDTDDLPMIPIYTKKQNTDNNIKAINVNIHNDDALPILPHIVDNDTDPNKLNVIM